PPTMLSVAEPAPDPTAPSGEVAPTEPSLAFDLVVSSFDFEGGIEQTLVDIAGAAESTGFRALLVMDHFRQVPQVGRAWDPMLESYTTLAYLAAKTDRLRLATLVTGVEHRNVGLLAKIFATLDVLSGGRAECGLGAGWFGAEQAAYGYPVNSDRVRLDALEDALQALPLLWGPGSKSFEGRTLSIPEALAYPRPIQDPVPILVGGGGEKRTLRLAAAYADACNVMGDPAVVEHKIEVLRAHCAELERDPSEITVTTLSPIVHAGSGRQLADLIESMRPANRSAEAFAAATNAATTDEHVARFRQLAELGVGRVCVALTGNTGPARVEAFAEVIEAFPSDRAP
ncbi:MAG: TIGR03560 family F420-dependent LLM class oxidoreductase, partial [Acidimicrobiales bacterium]